jgi:riboflavin biosynthesis pyrimidine reductase
MNERASDASLESAYLTDERPAHWLFVNMVTTIDGATAIDGRSSSIGDEQDTIVFRALRAVADAVIVAGATARAEGYKRPQLPAHLLRWRLERSLAPVPRIAIVSRSLEFDLGPFEDEPPVIVTSESSPAQRRRTLAAKTDVIVAGGERVDLFRAVSELREAGLGRLLSEGGPSLNGQLAALDLVDEWCVTVAPLIVSGESKRIVSGPAVGADVRGYRLDRALSGKTSLFTRWLRDV